MIARLLTSYLRFAPPRRGGNSSGQTLSLGFTLGYSLILPSGGVFINLDWPQEIDEGEFLRRMKTTPKGKTFKFLS